MPTRLALVLAGALLALALVQWRLRLIADESAGGSSAVLVLPVSAAVEGAADPGWLEDIEEPVIDIPEYIPPPITERPKAPVEFSAHPLEIDLGIPRVGGAIDEATATRDGD